ncbi:MAG TPA: DUF4112 domain-containing protein, partial [Thermoanaerobaculia bacterium]|nr:DUF4112 domain-containing protein [Thermoanaerobaculia bacterium]
PATALQGARRVSEKIHVPEVIEPDAKLPADLVALRRFAFLMDEAFVIPGTRLRFGVDALVGLIPGIGDIIGGVLSAWILIGAVRHRVSAPVLLRMSANILLDLFFGAVPLAGDVFDFLWEENLKNMRLLEKHRDRARPPRSPGQMAVFAVLIIAVVALAALGIIAAAIAGGLWLIRHARLPS